MNGILSRAPGQSAVRLLLGTHLLLHVHVGIIMFASTQADLMRRNMSGSIFLMSLMVLLVAIHGGPADDGTNWHLRQLKLRREDRR
jgi:hypothetical protein